MGLIWEIKEVINKIKKDGYNAQNLVGGHDHATFTHFKSLDHDGILPPKACFSGAFGAV